MPRPTRICGPSGSTATWAICSPCRDEITRPDCGRAQLRADHRGGRPADRASRRAGLHSPRTRRNVEAAITPDNCAEAIDLFEHALALDPRSVEAQGLLASTLTGRVFDQDDELAPLPISHARKRWSSKPWRHRPAAPLRIIAKGQRAARRVAMRGGNSRIRDSDRVQSQLSSVRSSIWAVQDPGGAIEEAVPLVEQAIRLSPRDPAITAWYSRDWGGAFAAIAHRRGDRLVRKSAERQPEITVPARLARLRLCPQRRDRPRRRRTRRSPKTKRRRLFSSIAKVKALGFYRSLSPKTRSLFEATYFAGLRKAGVPEE